MCGCAPHDKRGETDGFGAGHVEAQWKQSIEPVGRIGPVSRQRGEESGNRLYILISCRSAGLAYLMSHREPTPGMKPRNPESTHPILLFDQPKVIANSLTFFFSWQVDRLT